MNWNEKVSRKELALIAIGLLLLAWLADSKSLSKAYNFARTKLSDLLAPNTKPNHESS